MILDLEKACENILRRLACSSRSLGAASDIGSLPRSHDLPNGKDAGRLGKRRGLIVKGRLEIRRPLGVDAGYDLRITA
jgi:hypothetical protein